MRRLNCAVLAALLATSAAKPCRHTPSSVSSPVATQGTSTIDSSTNNVSTLPTLMSTSSSRDAVATIDTTSSVSISDTLPTPSSEASVATPSTTESESSSTIFTEPSITASTSSSGASTTETSSTRNSSAESSSSSTVDQCLQALTLRGDDAVADCSARLITTVTLPASTVTKAATVTEVESTFDLALFTETATTTALTETLLFTTSTTLTASTETDTVTEQTTVFATTTSVYTAPLTVTTAVFNYAGSPVKARGLTARQSVSPGLPDYAAPIGVETSTITLPAATETVTQVVSTTATTTWSTESTTQTDKVSVTATVLLTQTDIQSVTTTTTTTEMTTATSIETVQSTMTPTSVVLYSCQATGLNFRARNPFPDSTTRFMNTVSSNLNTLNSNLIAWQNLPSNPSAAALATSTWVLSAGEYLGLSSNSLVAYVIASSTASSLLARMDTPAAVAAGVAAGTYVQVAGCIDQATGRVNMVADGRSNMLSCGNALYLSRGTGTDIRSDCVLLSPTAISA
ncbi:hypothetical protein PFICI_11681 [Pestalotiopsis fici W106-1]|uniref:Uncharacterized protein n=1 Tax=Pestalotiopsis fici (strain W106-1 / CGMCC3.15140) TaxID=1229662 RepID=W3WR30_PESFW|nr:uncharacterized protein PFICI_11681 [Pestalotiopsis fici W106-1]ETS76294.1 hypothetical protein PFICI_11681 [Pestalotiopsis fici W106-1]